MMNNILKRLVESTKRRLSLRRARSYMIGKYPVILPSNHMLDIYQVGYKNYDKKLPIVASLIWKKYEVMTAIDIGANVGDTAGALRGACACPIICVEGNPNFLPYLKKNLAAIPGIFRIISKFIGPESASQVCNVITVNGTAHVIREERVSDLHSERGQSDDVIPITTYGAVITENSDLPTARLVKIDTDGFDFQIILSSINQIATDLPVIFFEFDPSFSPKNDSHEALKAVEALISVGYIHFVIYDNFGNFMFSFSSWVEDRFWDLFSFLEQSRRNGGGVSYLDVCCFSEQDKDIFLELVSGERIKR